MHIALITDGIYPYVIGGMQKHSYYIAKYLSKNKVNVDLYHTSLNKVYDIDKLEFFTEEEKKYIRSFVIDFPSPGKLPGHYLRESFAYSQKIFELFKKQADVDFIYVKGYAGWKLLEEKSKGYKCAPVGVKFHGMNMFQKSFSWRTSFENIMFRPATNFNMRHADYVFSYGGRITDIIKDAGIPVSKILEIPTGIEPAWLTEPVPSTAIRKFIFIGRYDKVKGIKELSEAIHNLGTGIGAAFHFIGPIPESVRIKLPHVIYHGEISDVNRIKTIIRGCDVLLCTSHTEGMPNVIIEAMASGLAIIATDVGAINTIVSESNGWLIDSCTTKQIQESIQKAIVLPADQLFRKKENSLDFTRKFLLWDKIAETLISKIKGALL